ncbi:hypothetical protein ACH4Q6_33125 [Streptomyces lydicus]
MKWPPGALTVDPLAEGAYFLIGAFGPEAVAYMQTHYPEWTVALAE